MSEATGSPAVPAPVPSMPQPTSSVARPPVAIVPGRLGVLGGTFDPIHLAHLAIAEEAREALGLERVLFVPAGQPWQKAGQVVSPALDRLAMVEAAVAGNPRFAVSRLDLDREGPTYTVETLAALAASEAAAGRDPDLWFILSAEALRGLPTWHEPDRLLELCRLAVVPREGVGERGLPVDVAWLARHLAGREDRVWPLAGPNLRLSASEIRARVAAGRSIRYLVPDAVAAYIEEHGLYTSPDGRDSRP